MIKPNPELGPAAGEGMKGKGKAMVAQDLPNEHLANALALGLGARVLVNIQPLSKEASSP